MTFVRSLAVSATVVIAALVALLLWGLMGNGSLAVPLLLDVTHGRSAAGAPQASLQFSPVVPVLTALLLALLLWGAGRLLADRRASGRPQP